MNQWTQVLLSTFLLVSGSAMAGEKISLPDFLALATNANLDLKIEQSKADAAQAKAIGLAIPPPMVGTSLMNEEGGHRTSGFEVNQVVPFPTKLFADHSARKNDALSQQETRKAREKEILAKAKLLYLGLWGAQERLTLLESKKTILNDHIKLSRSAARSDSFSAVHLLKSESDLDLLENNLITARQTFEERRLDASVFLNQKDFQFTVEEPSFSEAPQVAPDSTSHQVYAMQKDLQSAESREFVAKSAWLPDFNLRYKQMGATSMAGPYNEIMIGATVPFLFFWEPYSEAKRARSERVQKEYELEKRKHEIEARKTGLIARVQSLKQQIQTLKEKLIPRAEKRMRIVHNLAPRDMETLQDHRETMEAFPDLKMKALDLRLQYEEAVSELEQYSVEKDDTHE